MPYAPTCIQGNSGPEEPVVRVVLMAFPPQRSIGFRAIRLQKCLQR